MAKTALSEKTSETTAEVEASGDIIEGSPTGTLAVAPGAGITGDLDASDISFPRLQIVQGMGNLSENYKKGEIVLDGESLISDGPTPVEFTVCRIGKQFEENVDWDSGEIPRIVSKNEAVEIGGSFDLGANGEKPNWPWDGSGSGNSSKSSGQKSVLKTSPSPGTIEPGIARSSSCLSTRPIISATDTVAWLPSPSSPFEQWYFTSFPVYGFDAKVEVSMANCSNSLLDTETEVLVSGSNKDQPPLSMLNWKTPCSVRK